MRYAQKRFASAPKNVKVSNSKSWERARMRFYCASGLRSICAPWGRTTGQQQHSPTSQIPKKTTGGRKETKRFLAQSPAAQVWSHTRSLTGRCCRGVPRFCFRHSAFDGRRWAEWLSQRGGGPCCRFCGGARKI